jgi:hypothetical protein
LFFLGQLGEGFSEPPRLIKSDQLELEVYWRAPGLSKQIILGRRDRRDLPTDISYHRDHLGIVQNNFGDSIRLGDGDEALDVPHPLSGQGPDLYDYALVDSLGIELPDRAVRVYQVQFRPRAFDLPRIAGVVYLDVEQAEPVRLQFSFTPAAYRDATVEDITVVLDNALWFGRYWLPRRQELEIRRRTSWLDLPARGIIRGRWEIGSYEFNPELPPNLFQAGTPEIVSLPPSASDTFRWSEPLNEGIRRVAGPVEAADLEAVRTVIARAVEHRALNGLPRSSPRFGSLSDILHVNRVQGLTPGIGWRVRPGNRGMLVAATAGYGTADRRFTGRLSVSLPAGSWMVELRGAREVRDLDDQPVIAPVLNSIMAQERGADLGDYVLLHRAAFRIARSIGARGNAAVELATERPQDLAVAAGPASGQYRPNPSLGGPSRIVGRVALDGAFGSMASPLQASGRVSFEGGRIASGQYLRVAFDGEATADAGPTQVTLRTRAGVATAAVPVDRGFVLGGRGTLPGDPFRAWGGRHMAFGRIEWRLPVPFVALPLGGFGSTGPRAVLAPFVAAGWTGAALPGGVGSASPAVRVSAGAALEVFHRLLRVEVGTSLRRWRAEVAVDLRRDLDHVLGLAECP